MITIITYLVNELIFVGMKSVNPIQAPLGFIEHIWYFIWYWLPEVIHFVFERVRKELVRHNHSCCGIATCDKVFQLIPGIMPSTCYIDEGRIFHWTIHHASIFLMTYSIEKRIVATALLLHKADQ